MRKLPPTFVLAKFVNRLQDQGNHTLHTTDLGDGGMEGFDKSSSLPIKPLKYVFSGTKTNHHYQISFQGQFYASL